MNNRISVTLDKGKALLYRQNTTRLLYSCLLATIYIVYRLPLMSALAAITLVFALLLVTSVDLLVPLTQKLKFKSALLFANVLFLTLAISSPSYALFAGLEASLLSILALTGGGVATNYGAGVVTVFEICIMVVIIGLVVAMWLSRDDSEKVRNFGMSFLFVVGGVALLEAAGFLIFGAGGGDPGGAGGVANPI